MDYYSYANMLNFLANFFVYFFFLKMIPMIVLFHYLVGGWIFKQSQWTVSQQNSQRHGQAIQFKTCPFYRLQTFQSLY